MRLKRITSLLLALLVVASCFCADAAATDQNKKTTEVYAVYATGRFNMDVAGNTTVKANSSFPLEAGEVVTIKATYSPFSASVDFGLIAPDGLFYGLNTTTGSFDKAIKVSQRGYYTFAVRNNSSGTINVSGYINY